MIGSVDHLCPGGHADVSGSRVMANTKLSRSRRTRSADESHECRLSQRPRKQKRGRLWTQVSGSPFRSPGGAA